MASVIAGQRLSRRPRRYGVGVRFRGLRLGQDEQQHEVRQVEESVIQDCAPEAAGLLVKPALGEAEEEKGDECRVGPRLGKVVGGGEEDG